MSDIFNCPSCQIRVGLPKNYGGRNVRCPSCRAVFRPSPVIAQTESVLNMSHVSEPCEDGNGTSKSGATDVSRRIDQGLYGTVLQRNPTNDDLVNSNVDWSNAAVGRLPQPELEQLRETERWRSRIRVASILCMIMFWVNVIYCVCFLLASLIAIVETRRSQDFAPAVVVMITAFVMGGHAFLSRIAGHANRRCERWAPLTMFILEVLGVASLMISGVILALGDGVVALVLVWIAALLPGILATLFYRSWAAIPEYLSKPSWCRQTLEYCGL